MIGVYVENRKRTAPDTSNITFISQKVPRNQVVEVESAYIGDYTTANKLLLLGIRDVGGNDVYLAIDQATSTFYTHLDGHVILLEGESLIGVVASPTTNDVCYFSVHGKRYRLKEG